MRQTGLGGLSAKPRLPHYDIGLVRLSFIGTAKICHAEPHRNAYVFIWLGAGPLTTTLKPVVAEGAHTIGRLKGRSADDE